MFDLRPVTKPKFTIEPITPLSTTGQTSPTKAEAMTGKKPTIVPLMSWPRNSIGEVVLKIMIKTAFMELKLHRPRVVRGPRLS